MDKAMVQQLRAEIAAATPEEQANLKPLTDMIDAVVAQSKELDGLLADVVKERDATKRAKIAGKIKEMLPGLLGEDCSTLGVTS